jgi:hypothetical protein
VRGISFIAMAGALGFASAAVAGDKAWTPTAASNGVFSIETPCDASSIAATQGVADEALLPGVKFSPGSRVVCRDGKTMFVAGEIEVPNYPAAGPAVFDSFVAQAKNDKTAEGTPSTTVINGRRAWINRQEKDGALAQTGFVEINRATIVFMIAGVDADSSMKIEDQRALVDRFYASVKVTGK